ncbi:MAG: D-alanyl-D-alanine carboxypeptidase [Lachnospiraceae bacterium]|jgi:D-alanyl-D-alanine carboxypeptidase|nr:D-alanyl-D-alanine carboxypeptidase [Lachnospiraceae bacterium]
MFFSKKKAFILIFLVTIHSFFSTLLPVNAASLEELQNEAEARKLIPIETNSIENWPPGPAIGAEAAILMDANTGVILYAKNIDQPLFPASTTKLMTCLLAVEHASLNDMIPFSNDAVFGLEWDSSNIGMDVGQSLSLEEALYGILIGSANEVANAVAEYVGGSMDEFAIMMTEKARELGCKNTNFTNAHGLHDDDHYTTAYDLALIASAFFQNELLSKVANTDSYHFMPTPTQPDDFIKRNKHRLVNGEIEYENIIGGKTGYTSTARQTLVTCAEENNMKLICVILKEESPEQFNDTVKLFDYGFSNFQTANVAEHETRYNIENSSFFQTGNDVFGDSSPLLNLNSSSYVILPKTIEFADLASDISYQDENAQSVAEINYYYHGAFVGQATIDFATDSRSTYDFDPHLPTEDVTSEADAGKVIFVNIINVILILLGVAALIILFFVIRAFIINYQFNRRRSRRRVILRKRRRTNRFRDF